VNQSFQQLIDRALQRRRDLLSRDDLNAYRLFHDEFDGIAGLVIERFGPVLIVQLHEGRLAIEIDEIKSLAAALQEQLGTQAVYLKKFIRDRAGLDGDDAELHSDPRPWIGEPVDAEFAINENGLQFLIRPYDGFSVGLFLEHRDNRLMIRDLSANRRVLNLFAYTCGFSVAAAVGRAASVSSVDLSKRYLEWGKRNFETNCLDLSPHRFYASDTFDFFKRAARQQQRYDLAIIDPPTFSRQRRPASVFELEKDLPELLAGTFALLDPGAHVFFSTNTRTLHPRRILQELTAAAAPRRMTILRHPALPPDFSGDADYSKSLLIKLD
jgi:23S rRNA (cytosine1962-C5)-methyltransferase